MILIDLWYHFLPEIVFSEEEALENCRLRGVKNNFWPNSNTVMETPKKLFAIKLKNPLDIGANLTGQIYSTDEPVRFYQFSKTPWPKDQKLDTSMPAKYFAKKWSKEPNIVKCFPLFELRKKKFHFLYNGYMYSKLVLA